MRKARVLAVFGVLFAMFFVFSWFLLLVGQTVKVSNPTMAVSEECKDAYKNELKEFADLKDCSVKVDIYSSEKPNGTDYLTSMKSDVRAIYSVKDATLYYNTSLNDDLVVVNDVSEDKFVSTMKDVMAEVAKNKKKNWFVTTFKMEGNFMHYLAYAATPILLLALSICNLKTGKKKKKETEKSAESTPKK